jgi:hypothetical protein
LDGKPAEAGVHSFVEELLHFFLLGKLTHGQFT